MAEHLIISQLPPADPPDGNELVPVVQRGFTKRMVLSSWSIPGAVISSGQASQLAYYDAAGVVKGLSLGVGFTIAGGVLNYSDDDSGSGSGAILGGVQGGQANQLAYYDTTGNVVKGLSLGVGFTIAGGVLDYVGTGSGLGPDAALDDTAHAAIDDLGITVSDVAFDDLVNGGGTGSVTRSLTALLADVINVKNFGAVGNGSTDDTAAINAAIATVAAVGGIVFFPAGTYKITSAISITAASVHLRGAGTHSTQIMQATSTASVFTVSGTDAQIEHMLIGYSVTPGTTVIALDTSSTYGRFNHLTVYNVAHGIRASASASCQFFSFITVLTATGSCFWVDGGTDIQISHFLFLPGGSDNTASTWAKAGAFRVSGFVEGLVAHAGEVFGGLYSLAMSGTTLARGSCPAFNNFTDVFFDSSASYGVSLTNVMDTEFIGCWIACGRTTGAGLFGANLSSTSGIRFANCKFIACGSHGLVLNTGATHTTVQTCTFDSNGGYVTAGTAAGVAVAPNVNNFTVAGCRFSNGIIAAPVGGTMQNGIVVQSGTSNHYRIESNIFDASLGGPGVIDAGSGTDKQIETAIGNRGAMTATDLTLTTDASQTAVSGAWTQTTPAIAPASGTFTSAGATLRYKKIGRTVMFSVHGLITTPGTGTGGVNITMPFAPAWDSCFAGRETGVTGKTISGELFISSTTLAINNYDNTSIIAANAAFTINGAYEAAS